MSPVVARVGRGTWSPVGGLQPVEEGGQTYGFYALIAPKVGSQAAADPALDPYCDDYRAVFYGVRGLQTMLERRGLLERGSYRAGVFDAATDAAVRKGQLRWGLTSLTPGRVGHTFSTALMRPRLDSLERTYGIPGHHLFGVGHLESDGFDWAAVGRDTPDDDGHYQFRAVPGALTWWNGPLDGSAEEPITKAKAFGPLWASLQAARRMAFARRVLFAGKPDLTDVCSVVYHFSPARAEAWYASGSPPVDSDGVNRALGYWNGVNYRIRTYYR